MVHEVRFQAIGGPDLVGARLLMMQSADSPETILPEMVGAVTRADVPAPVVPAPPHQAALPSSPVDAAPSPAAPLALDIETMQTLLCHEHPPYLKKALLSAKRRLVTHHCHIVETGNESCRFRNSSTKVGKEVKTRNPAMT